MISRSLYLFKAGKRSRIMHLMKLEKEIMPRDLKWRRNILS